MQDSFRQMAESLKKKLKIDGRRLATAISFNVRGNFACVVLN